MLGAFNQLKVSCVDVCVLTVASLEVFYVLHTDPSGVKSGAARYVVNPTHSFVHYLWGKEFEVVTDHRDLVYLLHFRFDPGSTYLEADGIPGKDGGSRNLFWSSRSSRPGGLVLRRGRCGGKPHWERRTRRETGEQP